MELKNISYLRYNNYYIFFDYVSDISSDISSEVTNAPIDARGGASLQDKRAVGMTSVGISAKFSTRVKPVVNTPSGGINLFNSFTENRLQLIANFLEWACENGLIFEVCKKGVVYKNQLLNDLTITFGEYVSTLEVTLSFIEIETVTAQVKYPACTNTIKSGISKVTNLLQLNYTKFLKMFTEW